MHSSKLCKIFFVFTVVSAWATYVCIMSLIIVPALVKDAPCQVTNVSIQETKWIEDLGCAFNTKYMDTCHNCSHFPLQCCDPQHLVSNYLCQRANISFALVGGSEPNSYDVSCTENVVSCMRDYRYLMNVNNTFTCKKDGRGNLYFDKSNEGIIWSIVVMTVFNVLMPCIMYMCCLRKSRRYLEPIVP